jgi:ubiquinone/menaquinone biosynthesis C-methylase UbiE
MSEPTQNQAHDWDTVFGALAQSTVLDRIRRESYGENYIPALKALSMIMRSELRWCAEALHLEQGGTFIELGCGLGGPGLWIAKETGATVTGIDISAVALQYARTRSVSYIGAGRANYLVADAARLPIRGGTYRAALGIDVFQCLPDKQAAFAEVGRVLRPGGHLAFTTRERRAPDTPGGSDRFVADHEPLLRQAGFDLVQRHEPQGWEERHRLYYARILARREAIKAEGGEELESHVVRDAEAVLAMLGLTRRVLIVAVASGTAQLESDAHKARVVYLERSASLQGSITHSLHWRFLISSW